MIKIYLANLGKYNEGKLVGKWFTLPQDVETMKQQIGVADNTQYEEYAIHDYEAPFEIEEYESLQSLNEIAEKIKLDSDIQHLFKLWEKWEENKNYVRYNENFQNEILSLIINISDKYDLNVAYDIIHLDQLQEIIKEHANEHDFIRLKFLLNGIDNTDYKDYFYLDGYGNVNSFRTDDVHNLLIETFSKLKEVLKGRKEK